MSGCLWRRCGCLWRRCKGGARCVPVQLFLWLPPPPLAPACWPPLTPLLSVLCYYVRAYRKTKEKVLLSECLFLDWTGSFFTIVLKLSITQPACWLPCFHYYIHLIRGQHCHHARKGKRLESQVDGSASRTSLIGVGGHEVNIKWSLNRTKP